MPLLTSPIDGSVMKQVHRYGIEIDVCQTSGGIWLDKGELEKIMALLRDGAANEQPAPRREMRARYAAARYSECDDEDDRHEGDYRRHNSKSKLSRMMDIFDF